MTLFQNSPFSTLVCGVQGSGKSHTVSVLLENLFIPDLPSIGSCQRPLSGLVLHYSEGGSGARPCEAAWVACAKAKDIRTPSVRVYVSESSFATIKKVYEPLGKNVKVRRLKFLESELDAQAVLSMMAVGSSDSAPLYMHTLLSIMRELGENFNIHEFREKIDVAKQKMNPNQKAGLEQRLSLLDAFVDDHDDRKVSFFKEGYITIVDLSDPFIDPGSASSLFEIATRLFVRAKLSTGKVLVVDEAHKYLSASDGHSGLTKSLMTLIREQRHLGMRVIISTQEPTAVPPVLIDLCNIAIFHRFSSPAWWNAVAKRVCTDVSSEEGFERVVRLKTGQALVLCPSGLGLFAVTKKTASGVTVASKPKLAHFGRRHLIVKTRQRVTVDGGASVMALDT
ncbi:P-loop containing nucleoside triphosphate hydrolase protein [Lentinus tigrinus ALCF2SS1-6]|uniref:P-loop containing nucleoside triphosphate hydrolase protein n=1 Tax=Lentinus tigrinus ALCF2SS1-6 TaxID=1328759 RepID=A0A5C2SST7_9APHY|nr:P-loop containing nucleoside triphosphate hydrolase protein [Lentinus tigrinus ALCF2SS1-6]